jgi:MoxR-like ATPase
MENKIKTMGHEILKCSQPKIDLYNQSNMSLTSELTEILKLLALGLEKNKTIYLEGEPGVGKTKITEHLAQCLKLPIYIFQMSANVEFSDLIGGLELSYLNDQKQIDLNRRKALLDSIEKGEIFVLDESAMS